MFAGYFSITNSNTNSGVISSKLGANSANITSSNITSFGAVTLTSVSSPHFKHIMMHRSVIRGGTAEMEHVNKSTIQSGQTRVFEPGGYHLMLMQPAGSVKLGMSFPIKMKFKSGKEVTTIFKVKSH